MYRKLRKQIIMRRINLKALALLTLTMAFVITAAAAPRGAKHKAATRWSEDKANTWYAQLPWMSGCNYTPATAINQIEMWSKDTYDPVQIDKELGWAEELGFNTMRVFLSSVVYKNDPSGLKKRINNFLDICSRHGIRPFFVFFDDCWAEDSHYGKQPAPKTGVHNSGWVQDPPVPLRADTVKLYKELGKYVKDIVSTFRNDKRILLWDLYNEPGNRGHLAASLPLLKKAFEWARSANPSQPLTSAIYTLDKEFAPLSAFQLENSDVISYHNYKILRDHEAEIRFLQGFNRPLVCSEYMARPNGSTFATIMPLLKENKVVAINWGFVSGKTNTIYAWGKPMPDGSEPKVWFHDIYRQDKTPFDQKEVDLIKKLNGK